MADVLNKTADPVDYRRSVNEVLYDPADWFINPDVSAVYPDVPTKYWKRPLTDPVLEMGQAEKDAVDQAEQDAKVQSDRDAAIDASTDASGVGNQNRGLIETFNKRDNYIVNRLDELQSTLEAMKATTGAADNLRAAIPDSFLPTMTRALQDAITDYQDTINSGMVDAPEE